MRLLVVDEETLLADAIASGSPGLCRHSMAADAVDDCASAPESGVLARRGHRSPHRGGSLHHHEAAPNVAGSARGRSRTKFGVRL